MYAQWYQKLWRRERINRIDSQIITDIHRHIVLPGINIAAHSPTAWSGERLGKSLGTRLPSVCIDGAFFNKLITEVELFEGHCSSLHGLVLYIWGSAEKLSTRSKREWLGPWNLRVIPKIHAEVRHTWHIVSLVSLTLPLQKKKTPNIWSLKHCSVAAITSKLFENFLHFRHF